MLVTSRVSEHMAFIFLPSYMVYSDRLVVFPNESSGYFCTLQSRVHEIWARFFGSSLEDRLTYTPSDCFETFPFPKSWDTHPTLEAAGKMYYAYRATLMVDCSAGMTKAYNRFHDMYETDARIRVLRELHASMDRAVLDAYGWTDIPTDCEFVLDYEVDDATLGRKKKPYRYRWPNSVRDEVLARLLTLNAERTRDERRTAISPRPPTPAPIPFFHRSPA